MFDAIGPKKKKGAFAPLFDRLTNHNLEVEVEDEPYGFLSPEEQKASILEELTRLLNTRTPRLKQTDRKDEAANIHYGIPSNIGLHSITAYDGMSKAAWASIGSDLTAIITKFEPRLKSPTVIVEKYDKLTQSLKVSISGTIYYEREKERVAFPMDMSLLA
jgi:type VI secretion system lysozyme-like protein